MWDEAEAAFDYVDANGDGEITWPELKKVLDDHEPKKEGGKGKGGKGKKALVQRVMIQLRKGGDLTDEQKQEIADWVESELANDGTITKAEAQAAVQAFADKHGFEITDEMWAKLEELFDMVDTNGDGEIDGAEAQAAWEAHQGKGKGGKGKGKGGKGGKGKKALVQRVMIQL
jgi:Ca2+-binding EF-hand superfamily protein